MIAGLVLPRGRARRLACCSITDLLFDGARVWIYTGVVVVRDRRAVVRAPARAHVPRSAGRAVRAEPLPHGPPDERLLILGSTGSIGTQALDVVARAPEAFELVGLVRRALARGAGRAGARARRRRIALADPDAAARAAEAWTDGEVLAGARGARAARRRVRAPTSCSTRSSARAGLGPTIVALTEGIDVALANKESLVVGGELVMRARRGDRRADHPGRLRALGAAPADRGRARPARSTGSTLTASGGPFRGRTRAELEGVTRRAGARAPDLGDGRQDHDRLGDADEQGPRGDRGAPPVRHAVRADRRRRAPAVDRPRAGRALRRRDARAPRLPGHARADRLRAAPPGARRRAGARRSTSPRSAR